MYDYRNYRITDWWFHRKVQVGNDQEKAQSEKDSHSNKLRWEKTKLKIR